MQRMTSLESYMPGETVVAEIRRHIEMYNSDRPEIYRRCTLNAWLLMGAYLVAFALLLGGTLSAMQTGRGDNLFGAVLALGGAGAVWLWGVVWQPLKDHQISLRYGLFPKVFGFIDQVRYEAGLEPYFLSDLKRLKLVDFTKSKSDDVIHGVHEGMKFELAETELTTGSGKNERTTFKGLIFHFRLAETFPGLLVANKRSGWWARAMKDIWGTAPTDEIHSGNLRLDESHEFRTSNHAAAQPVIAGPLTSVLTWLGNEWHGGDVRIALSYDDGYLMMPTRQDYFALPDLECDINYERHVRPLVRELVQLLAAAHAVRNIG